MRDFTQNEVKLLSDAVAGISEVASIEFKRKCLAEITVKTDVVLDGRSKIRSIGDGKCWVNVSAVGNAKKKCVYIKIGTSGVRFDVVTNGWKVSEWRYLVGTIVKLAVSYSNYARAISIDLDVMSKLTKSNLTIVSGL